MRSLPHCRIIRDPNFGIVKPSGSMYSLCQPRNCSDEKEGQSNKAHRAHAQFSVLVCFFLSVVLWRSAKLGQRNQRLGVFLFRSIGHSQRSFPFSPPPPPPSCSPATSLRAAAAWWKKCYNCVCPLSNRNVRGSCLHRVCCFSAAAACPASSLIFQQAAASQQHHIASGQRKKRKKTAPPANLTSNGCLALAVACLSPTERKPPPSLCAVDRSSLLLASSSSSPRNSESLAAQLNLGGARHALRTLQRTLLPSVVYAHSLSETFFFPP